MKRKDKPINEDVDCSKVLFVESSLYSGNEEQLNLNYVK